MHKFLTHLYLNLETAVGRKKAVQDIDEIGEFKKRVVTLLVMSAFSNFPGASRACADFCDPTAVSRLNLETSTGHLHMLILSLNSMSHKNKPVHSLSEYTKQFILSAFLYFSLSINTLAQEPAPKNNTPDEEKVAKTTAPPLPQKQITRLANDTTRTHFPPDEDTSMALLAKKLPEDALLWLNAKSGRFLSIWQKDRSGYPKGALLIIHAEGEHPSWPNTTQPLHDTLPDYGWATLAVSLPAPDFLPAPKRTTPVKRIAFIDNTQTEKKTDEGGEQKMQTQEKQAQENNETILPTTTLSTTKPSDQSTEMQRKTSPEVIAERRLESALRFLHDQGQFNLILLGNGSGAIRANDFLKKLSPKITNPKMKKKLEKPIRAIIIVNGRNQLPTMKNPYQQWFSDPEVPVLDIFTNTDNRNSKEAKHRKTLARQKKVASYKQVKINRLTQKNSWGENRLSKRIRSFLDINAAGIEVKNAKIR